jgi:Xaa-Pro aminopeptidase
MERRLGRARAYLKGLDAILLLSRPSITYLSGYTGSDAVYLFTEDRSFLFVDSRNTLQAAQECTCEVREIRKRWEDIHEVLRETGIRTLGLESNILDLDSFIRMKDLYRGIEMTPLGNQLRNLRSIKDEHEHALMRQAALVSEQALDVVLGRGIVGRSEQEVALDLEWEMRTRGATAASFELIVASGPRSAMPHGTASGRVIGEGEAVIIDFGCILDGYCSDQTVTLLTGPMDDGFFQAYRAVQQAQEKAIMAVAPGARASEVDKAARDHLAGAGLASFFGHGLGHGVGMEVHEAPTVSPLSEDVLEEGMVITIEPGVYLPGKYGIRLEDMVVVTDNSCNRLTNIAKETIRIISQR